MFDRVLKRLCVTCSIHYEGELRLKACFTFRAFRAKKAKEILRTKKQNYLSKKFSFAQWKTTLNPQALFCYENSSTCLPLCPSFLHAKGVSRQYRQVNFLQNSVSQESTYLENIPCWSSWNDEGQMHARSWSIKNKLFYWGEMFC